MLRKGSLQLSINAIVVLILAITMLGLGLAFMRSTFGGVTAQFGEISAEVQKDMLDRLQQSPEDLVLNRYEVEIRQGESKEVYLAIRNELGNPATFLIDQKEESSKTCGAGEATTHCCISMGGSTCGDLSLSTFPKVTLTDGESKVLKLIISAGPQAGKDTYMMPIRVEAPESAVPFDETVTLNVVVR
ncbi:hypothetical protein KY312_02620 [Candidatus Woesearchaeota archaeon]|nr:hypothetical protein [Candidatus Woesearchaeota archaeon]